MFEPYDSWMILEKLRIFLVRSIFFVLLREVFALGMFDLDFFENLFRLGSHAATGPAQPTHCLTHSFPLHRCFQGLEKGCFGSKWNNRQDYGKGKRNRSSFKFIYLNKKSVIFNKISYILLLSTGNLYVLQHFTNFHQWYWSTRLYWFCNTFGTMPTIFRQFYHIIPSLQVSLEKFVTTTFGLKPLFWWISKLPLTAHNFVFFLCGNQEV